jgi:hypothetical protein
MRVKARMILQALGYASVYVLVFAAVFVHVATVSGAATASSAAAASDAVTASNAVTVPDVGAVPAAASFTLSILGMRCSCKPLGLQEHLSIFWHEGQIAIHITIKEMMN